MPSISVITSMAMKTLSALSVLSLALSLLAAPALRAQFYTSPGNATTISVIVENTETGRPCQGCSVQWTALPINQNSGSHFHPNTNGPTGTLYSTGTTTDISGHAVSQWTSKTATVAGTPRGYAGVYGVKICSPQANMPACVLATVTATYAGIAQAVATPGVQFISDSGHNNLGRGLTNFMATELTYIGSLYWALSGHGDFYVSRGSLATGGIYDLLQVGTYWTLTNTDDHMWGTGFDVFNSSNKALMNDFLDAVGEAPGFTGGACTAVGFSSWTHVMCGQGPQM
jgi:hypothetical protein